MRWTTFFAICIALALTGCSSPEERAHRALMDQIERQVHLPKGAGRLAEYSRYYAEGTKGDIVAVYLIIPKEDQRPGEICEELDTNLTSHSVPCQPIRIPWAIPAGAHKWLKEKSDLPVIDDGGCMEVNITYNEAKSELTSVECNGDA